MCQASQKQNQEDFKTVDNRFQSLKEKIKI